MQHNNTQHKATQPTGTQNNNNDVALGIRTMLSVLIANLTIMPSVVMLSVIVLTVVAPSSSTFLFSQRAINIQVAAPLDFQIL